MKILDAPIHLGSLAAESEKSNEDTHKNIWLVKKGDDSSVRVLICLPPPCYLITPPPFSIHLGSLVAESEKSNEDTHKNIWLVKKGDDSSVRVLPVSLDACLSLPPIHGS